MEKQENLEIEKRYLKLQDKEYNDETREVTGYAIVYDKESNPINGEFVEVIEKRALDNTDLANTYLLYQHNPDQVLASVKGNTLALTNTDKGLHFRATLPDTTLGRDTYELIKRGDLDSMSFGFSTRKDAWDVRSNPPKRKIQEIDKLYELSIVTYPAYNESVVSTRALNTLHECKECQLEEQRKLALLTEAQKMLQEISQEISQETKTEEKIVTGNSVSAKETYPNGYKKEIVSKETKVTTEVVTPL